MTAQTTSEAASPSEVASSPLTLTLFGPMQVLVEGRPLPRLRSRKSLWLLALLALRAGRPVEREWLAGTLWPDVDQSPAAANLRVVLSELRRALGIQGSRLETPGRHILSLDLDGADVDVRAFDEAVASREAAALARAVALYQGPLLEGCAEEWVGQERRAREQDCLEALQALGDAALAAGGDGAAGYYRRAVSLDPWREAAQRGLMQALAQGGTATRPWKPTRRSSGSYAGTTPGRRLMKRRLHCIHACARRRGAARPPRPSSPLERPPERPPRR